MFEEEQEEELEALKVIFGDRIQQISSHPIILKINNFADCKGYGLELEVEITEKYPQEVPICRLRVVSGKTDHLVLLEQFLKNEACKHVGTPMVFSLVTALEDWIITKALQTGISQPKSSSILPTNEGPSEPYYEDKVLTRDCFYKWLSQFLAEKINKSPNGIQKITGKDWFQNNKSLHIEFDESMDDPEYIFIEDEEAFRDLELAPSDGDEV